MTQRGFVILHMYIYTVQHADVAEWVLNKCVLEGHRLRASSGADDVSKSISAPADRNIAVYGVNAENDCDDKDIADVTPGNRTTIAEP